jgi:hypothetical protein
MPTIYVLTYCHRHGQTTSVYSTEVKANKAAAQIVAQHIDEIYRPELRKTIIKALNAQQYQQALALWGHYQCETDNDEAIVTSPCKVDAEVDDKPIQIRLKGTNESGKSPE